MPIIPGLAGGSPEGGDLDSGGAGDDIASLVAALDDDELQALEGAAAESKEAGELDAYLPAAEGDEPASDDDGGTDDAPAEEAAAPSEADDLETDDDAEPEEEDPTPHVRATEDAAKSAADSFAQLSKLVEDAGEHEKAGIDTDELESILEEAQEAADAAEKALDTAHNDPTAEEAEEAASDAQDAATTIQQSLDEAKGKIAANAAQAEQDAVPDEVRAMTAWAKQAAGI